MGIAATIVILVIIMYCCHREETLRNELMDTKKKMSEEFAKERREIWDNHQKEVEKLETTIENLKKSHETKEIRDSIISDYSNSLRIISDSADKQEILEEIPKLELAFCENFYHYWCRKYNSPIIESPELDLAVRDYYNDDYVNYHLKELMDEFGIST